MIHFLYSILRDTPRYLLAAFSILAGMLAVWLWGQQ